MRCFAWQAWAPGLKLRMAPVLTTLSQIMVRIAAVCKRRLCKVLSLAALWAKLMRSQARLRRKAARVRTQ